MSLSSNLEVHSSATDVYADYICSYRYECTIPHLTARLVRAANYLIMKDAFMYKFCWSTVGLVHCSVVNNMVLETLKVVCCSVTIIAVCVSRTYIKIKIWHYLAILYTMYRPMKVCKLSQLQYCKTCCRRETFNLPIQDTWQYLQHEIMPT